MIFLLQDIFIPVGNNGMQLGPVRRKLHPDEAVYDFAGRWDDMKKGSLRPNVGGIIFS
jgi:hypothetical protein